MTPILKALHTRVDEILYYVWDPIGVSDVPDVRDEYTSYVPQVVSLLLKSTPKEDLADHLALIQRDQMGMMPPDRNRAAYVAQLLIDTHDFVTGKPL